MMKKKVLVITYYWPPSGGAGVQRWLKFTKYLPEFNIEPLIVTVDPSFAEYPQIDETLAKDIPSEINIYKTYCRSIYNIYKKVSKSKTAPYGGFSNEANPTPIQKLSRFIRGNFFLPDPRKGWNKYACKEADALISKFGIDTVITTGPPHSTHLIGQKLKKNRPDITWIADFRDPWTDIYYYSSLYTTFPAHALNKYYECCVLEKCDKIITVSESLKVLLDSKSDKDLKSKTTVIYNGYDEDDFKNRQAEPENEFTITYTGTMRECNMNAFLNAVYELSEEINLKFRFVGQLDDNVRNLAKDLLKEHFEYITYVPHDKSISYLLKSDVLFLFIIDNPENKGVVSGKIFEYIGSGKPVLMVGPPDSDVAAILRENGWGETFHDDDKEGIKRFLKKIYNQSHSPITIQSNHQRSRYSRKELTRELANLINDISIKD